MKKELEIFFTAIMFYTRIPCPKWVKHSVEYPGHSTRYFPLIGWIVGGFSGAVFLLSAVILPTSVSIVLAIAAGIFITGGFHEDGLADTFDAFGGGWTKGKILAIMKDSRIGTYGVLGLIFTLLLKYLILVEIALLAPKTKIFLISENTGQWLFIPFVLIAGNSLSRLAAGTIIFTHQYVRRDDSSKSKPIAHGRGGVRSFLIMILFGVLPLVFLNTGQALLLMIPVLLIRHFLAAFFNKWIGGYTGDCLGAVQQISEVIFYLTFIGLWKFI